MSATLTVGISEAKTNLSKIIDQCNSMHKSVTIFKHNKPVARIEPILEEWPDEQYDFDKLPKDTQEAILSCERAIADGSYKDLMTAEELFKELGI